MSRWIRGPVFMEHVDLRAPVRGSFVSARRKRSRAATQAREVAYDLDVESFLPEAFFVDLSEAPDDESFLPDDSEVSEVSAVLAAPSLGLLSVSPVLSALPDLFL